MNFSENYENLKKLMEVNFEKKSLSHKINKKASLVPFKIENTFPEFEKGFYNIFGEFSRILLDKKMVKELSIDDMIQEIYSGDMIIDDSDKEYLTTLLDEYVFNEKNELKLSHPYLYLYIPLSNNKHKAGEKELALFLRDIFCFDNEKLVDFFNSKKSNQVLIKLILKYVPPLDDSKPEDKDYPKRKYYPKLDYVTQLFEKDIAFAMENKKFLDNMDNIFAFYYFFYISQLILKLSRGANYDDDVEKVYYLLDWEDPHPDRDAVKSYDFLKKVCHATYPRTSLLSQLNTLLGTEYYLEKELLVFFNELPLESRKNFLYYLKRWIIDYATVRNFDEVPLIDDMPDDYEELVKKLYGYLNDEKKGVSYKSKNFYNQNFEEFAKKYFLKRRGSYGYVLNMNRDMLQMLTALCVRDKKIKINQLFIEYEKRGIFFDVNSKKKIKIFLNNLNLIDKKSDGGDAEYVRPVL